MWASAGHSHCPLQWDTVRIRPWSSPGFFEYKNSLYKDLRVIVFLDFTGSDTT